VAGISYIGVNEQVVCEHKWGKFGYHRSFVTDPQCYAVHSLGNAGAYYISAGHPSVRNEIRVP
jgi:hypothetical protein